MYRVQVDGAVREIADLNDIAPSSKVKSMDLSDFRPMSEADLEVLATLTNLERLSLVMTPEAEPESDTRSATSEPTRPADSKSDAPTHRAREFTTALLEGILPDRAFFGLDTVILTGDFDQFSAVLSDPAEKQWEGLDRYRIVRTVRTHYLKKLLERAGQAAPTPAQVSKLDTLDLNRILPFDEEWTLRERAHATGSKFNLRDETLRRTLSRCLDRPVDLAGLETLELREDAKREFERCLSDPAYRHSKLPNPQLPRARIRRSPDLQALASLRRLQELTLVARHSVTFPAGPRTSSARLEVIGKRPDPRTRPCG